MWDSLGQVFETEAHVCNTIGAVCVTRGPVGHRDVLAKVKKMTAGYSGTPLAKKLGIKEGHSVLAINAPGNYAELLATLPDDVTMIHDSSDRTELDMVHLFTNGRDELFRELSRIKGLIKQNGTIWVSWYKKSAKLPTEITEDSVREAAFPLGLVDVKVCAVDEKWSGLRLVIRRENRS